MSVIVIMDSYSSYAGKIPLAVVRVPDGKMAEAVFKEWYEAEADLPGNAYEEVKKVINYVEYDVQGG